MYDGPFSIPSAATAARPRPAATVPRTGLGQTWASATPNAGGSAVIRSVTVERGEGAVGREADHRHLRPVDELLDEREPVARGAARRLDRRGRARAGSSTSDSPFWPCRSGALTTTGPATARQLVAAADDPRARLRDARLGEPLALAQLVRREHRGLRARSGAAGRARSAIRAATPTGQSVPGEIIPSISSAPASRSIAGSSSVETMQRRSAKPKAGRRGIAVDDGDPEAARARGLEQPELCGTGP